MSNTNKSSILRPPVRREPLQDLQMFSSANSDDDTTSTITLAGLAKRRVSFSGRNSVKEYVPCAEPICVMSTPAYEETFAHLSSDSSCLGNNSAHADENMSQTMCNNMNVNRCSNVGFPAAALPTRNNQNQNPNVQQNNCNRESERPNFNNAKGDENSLNESDMCMSITQEVMVKELHNANALDNSSGDMSFTRALDCVPPSLSQNNSTCMSFTKALAANETNMSLGNGASFVSHSNSMSFTKAIVNDKNVSSGDSCVSQNNSMSFTKAIGVNDVNTSTGNVSMSFTKAIVVNDEDNRNNTRGTVYDAINVSLSTTTKTNFTMGGDADEEMRKLMQEVDMEETYDSEKLKSYRLSDVSFLVRENLVSKKSRAKRRSSILTTSSNSPIDLTLTTCNRIAQDIDEEEEEIEEEGDVEEQEEEAVGDIELELEEEDMCNGGGAEEVRLEDKREEEKTTYEERELEEESCREDFEEDRCREVKGIEEEELVGGVGIDLEERPQTGLEEERQKEGKRRREEIELEDERSCKERRELEVETRCHEDEQFEDGRKEIAVVEENKLNRESDMNQIEDEFGEKMETDAEIQGGSANNELMQSNVEMSIGRSDEVDGKTEKSQMDISIANEEENIEIMNGVKEKQCEESRRAEEETLCLNLNSESECWVSCVGKEDERRQEKKCEGAVEQLSSKEDAERDESVEKERSADVDSNQSTPSTVVSNAVLLQPPPPTATSGHEHQSEQLLQGATRSKRKSDSLDLSREEHDIIESPSKMARIEMDDEAVMRSGVDRVERVEQQEPLCTPQQSHSAAVARNSTPRGSSLGKKSSTPHLQDGSVVLSSEVDVSLFQANCSLYASLAYSDSPNSTRSATSSSFCDSGAPICYQLQQVAPLECHYCFYSAAFVVRVETGAGATPQRHQATAVVNQDCKDYDLVFANKTKNLFGERVAACQSMAEVMETIADINSFVHSQEPLHRDLLRLRKGGQLEIVDGRLKYTALCYKNGIWFSVTMEPEIIWNGVSDDAITFKSFIGDVKESYIKHLYRCCVMSPQRLKHFTDSLESYVNNPTK